MLPGVAPAAKQAGAYVAHLIDAKVRGRALPHSFRYSDYGNLATIGHSKAVADFGWARFKGLFAWLLWSVVHVYFLIGFRSRIVVLTDWAGAYWTFRRYARVVADVRAPGAARD